MSPISSHLRSPPPTQYGPRFPAKSGESKLPEGLKDICCRNIHFAAICHTLGLAFKCQYQRLTHEQISFDEIPRIGSCDINKELPRLTNLSKEGFPALLT